MKILITAPAGSIGRRVLRELLAPEFSVRVIARDPGRVPEAIRAQVEVVCGSTDDATTLRRALDGVEALFLCVPSESIKETSVRGHYERFARAAGDAVRYAGTPRVVTISAAGKGLARNAGPMSGLHAMEDILNESGATIRHLRCGWLMENFLRQARPISERGVLSYPMPGEIPLPMIAAADIADTALRWLVRRDWSGLAGVALHGPEDISFAQAAAVFERILGRPVRYEEVSANHYVQTLAGQGANAEYARSLIEMFAELAGGISGAEPRTGKSTTPTSLAAWFETEFLSLAASIAPRSNLETACACSSPSLQERAG
jgi:uncharacterized protein YbjT (DUF2867 family)